MTANTNKQTTTVKSVLVDRPLPSDEDDLLNLNIFQEALINLIEHSDTPITIALQGDWGQGKTSIMNLVSLILCGKTFYENNSKQLSENYKSLLPPAYYGIFINTWQFTLSGTSEQAAYCILGSIINQLYTLHPIRKLYKQAKDAIIELAESHGSDIAKATATQLGTSSLLIQILCCAAYIFISQKKKQKSKIEQLKSSIKKLIDTIILEDKTKTGFIFFIDDLDRIKPELAVEILEILKNIFDFNKCIFLIAVDYNAIIKGLEPKLGEYSPENKHAFKAYFEKLIQLSLPIPKSQYAHDFIAATNLASGLFVKTDFINADLFRDILLKLSQVVKASVGYNPRSMKRLASFLSFIVSFNANTNIEQKIVDDNILIKALIFILVCLQTSYPDVYAFLRYRPDFNNWSNSIANRYDIPYYNNEQATVAEQKTYNMLPEWEKVLYRICQSDSFSQKHFSDLEVIFTIIHEIITNYASIYNLKASLSVALSMVEMVYPGTYTRKI